MPEISNIALLIINVTLNAIVLPLAAWAVRILYCMDKRISKLEWHIFEQPKTRRDYDNNARTLR